MFAPKITPTDCCSVIKPALTNDTTITVVAPDDWIIMVIKQPVNTAAKRLLVITVKKRCKLFPALFLNALAEHFHAVHEQCEASGKLKYNRYNAHDSAYHTSGKRYKSRADRLAIYRNRHLIVFGNAVALTQIGNKALTAQRLARNTHVASVQNKPVVGTS